MPSTTPPPRANRSQRRIPNSTSASGVTRIARKRPPLTPPLELRTKTVPMPTAPAISPARIESSAEAWQDESAPTVLRAAPVVRAAPVDLAPAPVGAVQPSSDNPRLRALLCYA